MRNIKLLVADLDKVSACDLDRCVDAQPSIPIADLR